MPCRQRHYDIDIDYAAADYFAIIRLYARHTNSVAQRHARHRRRRHAFTTSYVVIPTVHTSLPASYALSPSSATLLLLTVTPIALILITPLLIRCY